jgi:hypothetical protein
MANYYPALSRAISDLSPNSEEARRILFERARMILIEQLRSRQPAATELEIQRAALETAIRRIALEFSAIPQPASVATPTAEASTATDRKIARQAAIHSTAPSSRPRADSFSRDVKGVIGFVFGLLAVFSFEMLLFGGMEFISGHQLRPIGLGWIVAPFAAGVAGWKVFREINFTSIFRHNLGGVGVPATRT